MAPRVSTKFKAKYVIAFSSLGNVFHYSMGFFMKGTSDFTKYILAGLGATVNGVLGTFIWVGIGIYIHNVCEYYSVIDQKGYYYGLFSGIYTFSALAGAVILTFGL